MPFMIIRVLTGKCIASLFNKFNIEKGKTLENIAYLLVISAALMHAIWNAWVKVSTDRLILLTAVAFGQGILGLALASFVPFPSVESWPYILLSTLLNYAYFFFLYQAYEYMEFSHVYPLVRGLVPVIVAIGAYNIAGQESNFVGVFIISAGICGIAYGILSSALSKITHIAMAFLTALVIAAYTLSDGIGVRLNDNPLSYVAWLFILEIPVVFFTLYYRRKIVFAVVSAERWTLSGCALFSALAYGLSVVASAYIPLYIVSSIRETSVIMAALIGIIFFKERPWKMRLVMSFVVFLGVVVMVT